MAVGKNGRNCHTGDPSDDRPSRLVSHVTHHLFDLFGRLLRLPALVYLSL